MKNKKDIYYNQLSNGIKILPCNDNYFTTLGLEKDKNEIRKHDFIIGDIYVKINKNEITLFTQGYDSIIFNKKDLIKVLEIIKKEK